MSDVPYAVRNRLAPLGALKTTDIPKVRRMSSSRQQTPGLRGLLFNFDPAPSAAATNLGAIKPHQGLSNLIKVYKPSSTTLSLHHPYRRPISQIRPIRPTLSFSTATLGDRAP